MAGPRMSHARCGMGVTAMPDGKILDVGGCGGNLVYRSSVEVIDRCAERWAALTLMKRGRSGVA
ncbi:unnamed protein product [Ectocarpus sp. 12 AP-2014]